MDRRRFLEAAGGAAVLSLTTPMTPAAAAEIDTLLGLLERTPRAQILERVVGRIREGVRYEDLLAALMLAAVRNVQPYPDVGFKYHTVMVLQAVHLTAIRMSSAERWLPLIWGIDYFKETQAQELRESGWTMRARSAGASRTHEQARRALERALDRWDLEAADAAVVDFSAHAAPNDAFRMLFQYAARDFRSIGHKAIAAANAHRLLTLLGWQHREPVLRSLVAAILNHDDEPNPATADLEADAAGRRNRQLLAEIPAGWAAGRLDSIASRDLLAVLRAGDAFEASLAAVRLLQTGISPASIWHSLHAAGAELMLTDPRIIALHAQTSANALHYAFRATGDPETQLLMLLQCASFIPMFRASIRGRDRLISLAGLEPAAVSGGAEADLADVFSTERDKPASIAKALAFLEGGGSAETLMDRVRSYVVAAAANSHDYKFAEAVFETHGWTVDSPWRNRHLAAGFVYFSGPADSPSSVIRDARALLRA